MPASALNSMGNVTPATAARAREILAAAENAGHRVETIYGYNPASRPEHSSGRALDFMVDNKAEGDWIAAYAQRNARRLGVKWVIWWQRIWSQARSGEGWRPMADRGSWTQNHKDHPHIFFDESGYRAPLQPLPPVENTVSDALWTGQQLVKHGFDRHYRVGPSTSWGPADEANLREFQMIRMGRYTGLGQVDDRTRAALNADRFVSSVRHAVEYHTPADVRILKMGALKLGVAPPDAQRSPGWWNADLSRSSDPAKDVGRWYWEAQLNWQVAIGDEPTPPLGPKQWALLGEKSRLFKGVE